MRIPKKYIDTAFRALEDSKLKPEDFRIDHLKGDRLQLTYMGIKTKPFFLFERVEQELYVISYIDITEGAKVEKHIRKWRGLSEEMIDKTIKDQLTILLSSWLTQLHIEIVEPNSFSKYFRATFENNDAEKKENSNVLITEGKKGDNN